MGKRITSDENKVESTFEELSNFAESLNHGSDEPEDDIPLFEDDETPLEDAEELNVDALDLDAFNALEIEDEHAHAHAEKPAKSAVKNTTEGSIDEMALAVDSMNSFAAQPKEPKQAKSSKKGDEPHDPLSDHLYAVDVEDGIFVAEADNIPAHLMDEIIDIDRDFVLKTVDGFGSVDVSNFYDYIVRENKKYDQQTSGKAEPEIAPVPAQVKEVPKEPIPPKAGKSEPAAKGETDDFLKAIGLEFVDSEKMGDDDYKNRFYKKKAVFHHGVPSAAELSKGYESSGSGEEIFIDIDALLAGKNPVVSGSDFIIGGKKPLTENKSALNPPKAEELKVKLPDNFVLSPIDLDEAEKIAAEDILILSEDDLIEELEMSDLEPVTETALPKKAPAEPQEKTVAPSVEYFCSTPENFDDASKTSIEDDITRPQAIVIEESADDIRHKLNNYSSVPNGLQDITDRVVILEDVNDIDRFLENFDENKREDVRKLLTYLDGLFEKLPEEVIKRFAHSEYFDLYMKVMKEMGAENGFTGKS